MRLTWLDSNSWLIETKQMRILLDPWLVDDLVFANQTWFFRGYRQQPRAIPENIDLIILSQGLEDHSHPPTLKALDHNIPVVASPNASKVVKELGYTQITTLAHGQEQIIPGKLKITATRGSQVGMSSIENGYLIQDLDDNTTIYYEPHGNHSPQLQDIPPVDVVITPTISIDIPLLGAVIRGLESTVQVAKWLKPQYIIPTAAGGDVEFEGLLSSLLQAKGSNEELRALLLQNQLDCQVLEPKPGEVVEIGRSMVGQ